MPKKLLLAIAERAIKTFAQGFVGSYPVAASFDTNAFLAAATVGLNAALLSVMTSLASMRFGKNGPSLATEHVEADATETS